MANVMRSVQLLWSNLPKYKYIEAPPATCHRHSNLLKARVCVDRVEQPAMGSI
jgi:hypothetical protein